MISSIPQKRSAFGSACPNSGRSAPRPFPKAILLVAIDLAIPHDFSGQVQITFCTLRMNIVKEDGLPIAGSFAQPNISRDDRPEYLFFKVVSHFLGDLMSEIIPAVEHGEETSLNLQFWIQ